MEPNLSRATQDLTNAWLAANCIGQDVDENLKSCLINLSSGLLAMAQSSSRSEEVASAAQPVAPERAHLRTRSGVGIGIVDR